MFCSSQNAFVFIIYFDPNRDHLGGTEAINFTGDHTRTQNLALQLSKNVALSKLPVPLFSHP